jgi:hypothetical protein
MKVLRALFGGVLGAAAMTLVMALCRLGGVPVGLELLLGTLATGSLGFMSWVVGVSLHLALGALLALVYAWVFERGTQLAGAWVGASVATLHATLAGVVLAAVPSLHPLVPEALPGPGAFFIGLGASGLLLFVLLHLLYGAIVGSFYGPVKSGRVAFAPRRLSATRF